MSLRAIWASVVLAVTLISLGCSPERSAESKNILTGKVTYQGKLMPDMVMTVTTADGKKSGGMTNLQGEYTVPDAPVGKVQFTFSASKGVPKKYEQPTPELTFDYTGGAKTFDIDLGK